MFQLHITIPKNKRKTKITWNKKLTTTYTAQLQYMHTYLVCWYCHEWTFSDESGLSQAKRYIFLLESPEVLVLKCFFPYDFYLVWYANFKPWQLSYLLMMQIVEMSTSVEFKMWSMSPLIAVPLISQSQSHHNMGVAWGIIHTLTWG